MRTTKRIEAMKRVEAIGVFALLSLLTGLAAGCAGGSGKGSTVTTSQSSPRTYFAAAVAGENPDNIDSSLSLATYTIDDTADTFAQFTYSFTGTQEGPQMNYSGSTTALSRGLLSLGIDFSSGAFGKSYPTGNFAIELAGQAGGLVNLQGMPFVPLVAAQDCPSFTTTQTFQFVSIPPWNPLDTAYGRVDISTSGSTVTFNNIQQFTSTGSQVTSYPDLTNNPSAITSTTGACSSTFYGNTVSVPNPLTITNPGVGQSVTPGAIVGIGPSNLLVEANKSYGSEAGNSSTSGYQPFLGAGTGAMGLPQPSSPFSSTSINALTGAQYLGVFWGSGSVHDWSSLVASFGFPSLLSSCASIIPPGVTLTNPIYGGDFPDNNPGSAAVQANGGYGNCDFVIDLGAQDSANNGLFPKSIVYVGPGFPINTTKSTYSFNATAIAGQLNGKFAIFLIGVDTTGTPNQTWGIYLLQSN